MRAGQEVEVLNQTRYSRSGYRRQKVSQMFFMDDIFIFRGMEMKIDFYWKSIILTVQVLFISQYRNYCLGCCQILCSFEGQVFNIHSFYSHFLQCSFSLIFFQSEEDDDFNRSHLFFMCCVCDNKINGKRRNILFLPTIQI